MPRLTVALMTRQEAGPDRFLREVLHRCRAIADEIVVLDDGSTDDTVEVCEWFGANIYHRNALQPAWGNEASARQMLWDVALNHCTGQADWLLVCDADQILVGDPRPLMDSTVVNTWSFVLFDLWSPTEYREDRLWQGHSFHRPWMFAPHRVPGGWTPVWNQAQIHTGHCPVNWPMLSGNAPADKYHWLHRAYQTPALRQQKYDQYMAQAHQLSPFQRQHAASILDPQ